MAKKVTKKSAPEAVSPPPERPRMYLEGKDAQKMMGVPVGKKVKMMVEVEVTGQSSRRDYFDPNKKRHSVDMEIHRMKPVSKSKPAPKRKK